MRRSDSVNKQTLVFPVIGDDNFDFANMKWQVLDVDTINRRALLLSKIVLEEKRYHHSLEATNWADSELRNYLNEKFLNDRFAQVDKDRIIKSALKNDKNQWYDTDGGESTADYIFLLSVDEVLQYFGDSGDLESNKRWASKDGEWVLNESEGWLLNDEFNNKRIAATENGTAIHWWLRSPGHDGAYAACILLRGPIVMDGHDVNDTEGFGVRPALWLKI